VLISPDGIEHASRTDSASDFDNPPRGILSDEAVQDLRFDGSITVAKMDTQQLFVSLEASHFV
jgi:hypothetical protein